MKQTDSPIYQTILDLPLIKGVSATRLTEIAGRYKLNFVKYSPGDTIIHNGEQCESIKFILSGSVRTKICATDNALCVEQTLIAPQVIAPDYLFGRITAYPGTAQAQTTVGIMEISKEEYRKMLASDSIFLFNYLNAVCARAQRGVRGLIALASSGSVERIAYWVVSLTQLGATEIRLSSATAALNDIIGIPLPSWRAAMKQLTDSGIIAEESPQSFTVNSRNALLNLIS